MCVKTCFPHSSVQIGKLKPLTATGSVTQQDKTEPGLKRGQQAPGPVLSCQGLPNCRSQDQVPDRGPRLTTWQDKAPGVSLLPPLPGPPLLKGQANSQEFFRKTVLLMNLKKRSA